VTIRLFDDTTGDAGVRRIWPHLLVVTRLFVLVALVVGFSRPSLAQEGHPLTGTWHGTWGPSASDRHDVTIVLDYDGKAITGMMNPGPDAIHFEKVTLEPSSWTVRFEATPKGSGKAAAPILIEAKIEDITNRRRSLVGTWTQGGARNEFKASRDD
jgi:hypothetical protein